MKIRMRCSIDFGDPVDLYKFMTLAPKGAPEEQFARDVLTDHQIYFQRPNLFNDPYDCLPAIHVEMTPERWERAKARSGPHENAHLKGLLSPQEMEGVEAVLGGDFNPEVFADPAFQIGAAASYREFAYSQFGVLCLSRRVDSTLMWSHYTDKHHGFALRFDGEADLFKEAQPVIYTSTRPLIDPGSGDANDMARALLYKARDWRYEQESRITRISRPGLHPYPPKALRAVIFGMNMTDADQQRIRKMCAAGATSPSFHRAVDDRSSYRMAIIPAD